MFSRTGVPVAILMGLSLSPIFAQQQATSTILTTSLNPVSFGQAVTLTASVSPANAAGKVTFYDGINLLGTRRLAGGQAFITTSLLPSGPRSLKAFYSGDGVHGASASAVLRQTVIALPQSGFQPAVNYPAGESARFIALADFNGDGKADAAVANSASSSISILLGNGDGTFQNPVSYFTGYSPSFLATGDFNGDGATDLVAANGADGSISVLIGNADGTFQNALTYVVQGAPASIAVADFNLDGYADIAIVLQSRGVAVLLSNGDGTFQNARISEAGLAPFALAVGDFNGDGKADLAVANSTNWGTMSVLLGNGDGTFQTSTDYTLANAYYPWAIVAGDYNGDGKTDLAIANYTSNNVSVILGNGDGTFRAAVNYDAGHYPASMATGDFNGDGAADLVVTNANDGTVSVLLGNGDGTFQGAAHYGAAGVPVSVAVGELNGNGGTDLALAAVNGISVLLGDPKLSQTITFGGLSDRTLGSAPFTIAASASSGLPVGFLSNTVCTISGATVTLTAPGSCSITAIQGGDAAFASAMPVTRTFTVYPAPPQPPALTTSSALPAGATAVLYSQQFQAVGGSAPYTWILAGGSLPAGLSLNSAGLLQGTPSASGVFSFTIEVIGADGAAASSPFSLTVDQTLILPHFAAGGSYTTVVCALNTSNQAAQFSAAFRGDNGSPASLTIAGVGSVASLTRTVAAGAVQCFEASDPRSPIIAGSALIKADPGITIDALFRNAAIDGRYYEASVPAMGAASELIATFDFTVFEPTASQIFTGIAVANMDSATVANVACTARDTEGNAIPNAVSIPALNPGGHWADFRFPALNGLRGTLDCVSNTRIGVLGLRFLGYSAFSSLPVIVPGSSAGTSIPHFAAGGSYVTGFFVINSAAAPAHFAIAFHNDQSAPAPLAIAGLGSVSTLSDTVPAHGLRYYEASSSEGQTIVGSAIVSADLGIAIQALFRNHAVDGNYYEASVPTSSGSREFEMPFDGTTFAPTGDSTITGIAIANMDTAQQANVTCVAKDASGNVIPNALSLPALSAGGHWADFRFPALNGKQGTIDCVSNTKISAIGLRFLGANAFSSLPVSVK